jgi:hypothetical protein
LKGLSQALGGMSQAQWGLKSGPLGQYCNFCGSKAQKRYFCRILMHINSTKPDFPKTWRLEIWYTALCSEILRSPDLFWDVFTL